MVLANANAFECMNMFEMHMIIKFVVELNCYSFYGKLVKTSLFKRDVP